MAAKTAMRVVARGMGVGGREVVKQQGVKIWREGCSSPTISMSEAAIKPLVGKAYAEVMRPGLTVASDMLLAAEDIPYRASAPSTVHTSVGVPVGTHNFVEEFRKHLPFCPNKNPDWAVDLQVEGASGVHAAISTLRMRQPEGRRKVAVANQSYHGPVTSSNGTLSMLDQAVYPAPTFSRLKPSETPVELADRSLAEFTEWLDSGAAAEVGVILFEPQWGTSALAQPWPQRTLRKYVAAAQDRDIKVVCDEVMCGLFRHGQGPMFLSERFGIATADAYVVSKGLGAGFYPLTATVFREGGDAIQVKERHTFAGGSGPALMTATRVMQKLPEYNVQYLDAIVRKHLVKPFKEMGVRVNGQGLLWGIPLALETYPQMVENCDRLDVAPYFVGHGALVTPPFDIDPCHLIEGCRRLVWAHEQIA